MLILDGATAALKLITSAVSNIEPHVSWVDNNAGAITASFTNTVDITTAATTTICAAPGAGKQRNIKLISIKNSHATASCNCTVVHDDGTVAQGITPTIPLAAGESFTFSEYGELRVYDATGAAKMAQSGSGRWLKTTVLTAGVTFATGPQTKSIRVRLQAAGGGGGGCTSVAAAASAGGGGGAGGYVEKTYAVQPSTNYTYALGAAGNGASGALGGTAADSTFTDGTTLITAKGGAGAPVATALTTLSAYVGGSGGAASTNGDVNSAGENGDPGMTLIVATPIVVSGNGGNSQFGAGGKGIAAVGNGNNAVGFGGGGGGAATGASAVRTGGNGGAAVIIIDEFA